MDLHILDSNTEQIKAIAKQIVSIVTNTLQNKNQVTIAVSGGKSPIALFEYLNNLDLEWNKVTITLVDERVVDTSSPDSNEYTVRNYLLKNRAISAKFLGLFNSKLSTEEQINQLNQTSKQIDLAILGMGEDGHTASIFPECTEFNTAIDLNNAVQYIATTPLSAKYQRISLTLHALSNIPNLILSVSGEIKAKVLNEAKIKNNPNYPISYLISNRPDLKAYWHN